MGVKVTENLELKVATEVKEENLLVPISYRERLRECFRKKDELYYELCILCYEIKTYEIWKKEGYESIGEYIKEFEEEYEFKVSTFYAFAKMGEFIKKYEFTLEEIKDFGFSKFREFVYFCEANDLSEEGVRKLFQGSMNLSLREFRKRLSKVSEILGGERRQVEKEMDRETVETLSQFDESESELRDIFEEEPVDIQIKDYVRSLMKEEDREKETGTKKEELLKTFESYVSSIQKKEQTQNIILTYTQEVYEDVIKPAFELVKRKTGIENVNEIVLYIIYSFIQEHLEEIRLIKELEENLK